MDFENMFITINVFGPSEPPSQSDLCTRKCFPVKPQELPSRLKKRLPITPTHKERRRIPFYTLRRQDQKVRLPKSPCIPKENRDGDHFSRC